MLNMQEIITYILIGVSVVYAIYRLVRHLHHGDKNTDHKCESCDKDLCCNVNEEDKKGCRPMKESNQCMNCPFNTTTRSR